MDVSINGAPIYTIPIGGGIQISATIISSWIVMILITGVCIWLTRDLKVTGISKRQAAAEDSKAKIFMVVFLLCLFSRGSFAVCFL